MIRIQTVVQHAGPRRAHLLEPLLAGLPPGAQVVVDPGADDTRRSPWRCYLACLSTLEPDASHLLIVQDDAETCRDFPQALEQAVAARPDNPVVLFVPGAGSNHRRVLDACYHGLNWAQLDERQWVPAVAVVWPRSAVESLLSYAERHPFPPSQTADDSNLGAWMRAEGVTVLATVPSLIEHPDTSPSLVGTAHFSGMAPHRCAACWTGREWSPLEIEW